MLKASHSAIYSTPLAVSIVFHGLIALMIVTSAFLSKTIRREISVILTEESMHVAAPTAVGGAPIRSGGRTFNKDKHIRPLKQQSATEHPNVAGRRDLYPADNTQVYAASPSPITKQESIETSTSDQISEDASITTFGGGNETAQTGGHLNSSPSIDSATGGTGAPFGRDVAFGGISGPSFLHREIPAYPSMARKKGKEGRVILRLTIDEQGSLIKIDIVEEPGYGFADAAIAAAKKSTFAPAKKDGRRVAVTALLPVRFQLKQAD